MSLGFKFIRHPAYGWVLRWRTKTVSSISYQPQFSAGLRIVRDCAGRPLHAWHVDYYHVYFRLGCVRLHWRRPASRWGRVAA